MKVTVNGREYDGARLSPIGAQSGTVHRPHQDEDSLGCYFSTACGRATTRQEPLAQALRRNARPCSHCFPTNGVTS